MADSCTYAFTVEWFDQQANLVKEYALVYYDGGVSHGMLEMVNPSTNKTFVKKALYPAVTLDMLYAGATLVVHARQLTVTGYGDVATERACLATRRTQLLLVLPTGYNQAGEATSAVYATGGLGVVSSSMFRLGRGEAAELAALAGLGDGAELCRDAVVAMELVTYAPGQVPPAVKARAAANSSGGGGGGGGGGAAASAEAVAEALNRKYGAVLCVGISGGAAAAAAALLRDRPANTAVYDNCSLCLVRPSVLRRAAEGDVLDAILAAGVEVSAMKRLHLDRLQASELLDVYKAPGILPGGASYAESLAELASGPLLALQLRGEEIVERFREFCGPVRVEIARALYPDSLRARFGAADGGCGGEAGAGGVHCTDLPEDGVLECRYVFEVLE